MRGTLLACVVVLVGCFQPTTENVVGPEGGTLHFSGAALVIPPGALEWDVPFTATAVALPPGAPRALGPAFDFGPDSMRFKKPVELLLRVDLPDSTVEVLTSPSTSGPWERLPTQLVDGLARVRVTHFSVYYPSEPVPDAGVDAGVVDGGVDAGRDAGRDAGVDAGVDAGRDAGVDAGVDAGLSCATTCTAIGSACDRSVGRCVFGYRSLRILEPLDGSVARVDGGTVTSTIELTPIEGLTPVPPVEVQAMLWFVISNTWPVFTPVADGGPWVSTFPVTSQSGAPYELQVAVVFDAFRDGDGGVLALRDRVHFTTP